MQSVTPPEDLAPPPEPQRGRLAQALPWLRRVLPVVFLGLVAVLAWHELRTIDVLALRQSVRAVPGGQLLGLVLFALLAVLAMTWYDWLLCRWMAIRLPLPVLARYAWVANSFNNLIGLSGLAGSGIRYLLLGRQRVSPTTAAAYSGLLMLSIPVGLSVLAVPVLLLGGNIIAALPIPNWMSFNALALFAAFLPVYLALTGRGRLQRHFLGSPLTIARRLALVGVSVLDWLLALGVAWACLRVAGAGLVPAQFTVAFVLAAAMGIFSLIPGGLGVFDGTLLLALTGQGVPGADALTGIVLFRLVYYVVPWLIGLYLGVGLLAVRDNVVLARLARHWQDNALLGVVRLPLTWLSAIGVRMLGYLTFAAGAVLLVSAAFPALVDRLHALHAYMPLPAVEGSHVLSVVIGVLLIALSRGIADQVASAYRLSLILLIGGAFFTFLKGVDIEEALFVLAVAGLLRLRSKDFYRVAYPLLSTRSLYWLIALVGAVAGYAVLGAVLHGEINIQHPLWRLADEIRAPLFLHSLLFAVLALLGFIGWALFRMPGPALAPPSDRELDQAREFLRGHGGSALTHLMFMGDKHLFYAAEGRALIQFGHIRDRLIALGDPVGDPEHLDAAIREFREYADRYNRVPVFYQAGDDYLHHYHDNGFSLFKLGEQALVRTADFTLAGKRGEPLRNSVNRAQRAGVRVEFLEPPLDAALWAELKAVSDAWLLDKDAAEKGFSLGRFERRYLDASPVAVARAPERVLAFANLMPDYGPMQELTVDLMRHAPDAPPGIMDFMFVQLTQYARERGYRYFNLGMAPLAGVGDTRYARTQEKIARLAYEYGNRFYNYKGLRSFKEKFQPEWRSAYLAYPYFTPLPGLLVDIAALIAGGYRRIVFREKPGAPL